MAGVLIVLAPLPTSIEPEMVAEVSGLLEVTVIGVAPVRVRRPTAATVGVAVPPLLSKARLFNVLLPTRVNTDPPRRVTVLAAAIWPAFVNMVIFALLRVMP